MTSQGLSMLELIIVLMLIAIVMTYAVPSYQLMMQRQHMRISKDSLNTSLVLARNTSITRNQQVMLCPTNDGLSCEGEKFEQGWIVFFDLNKNAQREPSMEALIWVQNKLHKNLTVRASSAYKNGIAFTPNGRLARGFSGNVILCAQGSTEYAIKIIMIASGRMRIEQDKLSNCNLG